MSIKTLGLVGVLFASVVTPVAPVAFAAGESWVAGGVSGGAAVNFGVGGFSVGYEGAGGTFSFTGITDVSVGGGAQGVVYGGQGQVSGAAGSNASARQNFATTYVGSNASAGSAAVVNYGGVAESFASSGASGFATSGWW